MFICFLQAELPADICGSTIITLRTSAFILFFGIPYHLLCHLTLPVHPSMGCSWLLFCIMCSYLQTTVILITETSLSEPGSSISLKISSLSLASGFMDEKLNFLQWSWKVISDTQIDTHWTYSRKRNVCLSTENLAFKRIFQRLNCCFLDSQCKRKKVVK